MVRPQVRPPCGLARPTSCRCAGRFLPLVAEMPHGGFKKSGYGRDLSMYGFEDYTRIKHAMSYRGV
jgi:betaine-aldehyde dehydrogenase